MISQIGPPVYPNGLTIKDANQHIKKCVLT